MVSRIRGTNCVMFSNGVLSQVVYKPPPPGASRKPFNSVNSVNKYIKYNLDIIIDVRQY